MMGANNGSGPCGACKFLRKKCVKGCIFAPYFDPDQGTAHFAAVHKVFGASNASKLLLHIPAHKRLDAVVTLCYEALARVRDPVYGCVGHVFTLQQQVNIVVLKSCRKTFSHTIQFLSHPCDKLKRKSTESNGVFESTESKEKITEEKLLT
ncbi:LOB domain-containing protein [Salix suchowensis]|nr:LOB domain-containing protein [Salix suchowensis]